MNKILIIEDDPVIARVYGTKYSTSGFETRVASDGEAALSLVKTFKPDLIHLDLLIPKMNGVEVIKHIRRSPELQALPIVVLSNTYQNRLVKGALEAGATECVSKATSTPRMMVTIMEKLRDRQLKGAGAGNIAAPLGSAVPPSSVDDRSLAAIGSIGPVSHAVPSTRTSEALRDAAFHAEFRADFLDRAPQLMARLRSFMEPLLRAETAQARQTTIAELCCSARWFAGQAGLAGFESLSGTTNALVALLHDLLESPEHLSPSALRTILDVTDSLTHILENAPCSTAAETAPVVLVVEDEMMSRRALVRALARIHAPTIAVDDPNVALRLIEENRFGLVLLDVGMPEMSGFDLCRRLRSSSANKATPVVFVTSHAEFEDREAALAAGGNDLIAKPFLLMELAVKALSLLTGGPRSARCGETPGTAAAA
jgi:DNA-binding response OmpR family regulator